MMTALKTLDVGWAKSTLTTCKDQPIEKVLAALHMLRYECVDMPPEYREKSREWLQSRGYGRIYKQPWPEKGLP